MLQKHRRRFIRCTRPASRLGRAEEGAISVEMALVAGVLMIALLPMIDAGFALYRSIQLAGAVRAGMHYAHSNPENTTGIEQAIRAASNLTEDNLDVDIEEVCECGGLTASCLASCSTGMAQYISISASYAEPTLLDYGNGSLLDITQTKRVRTE